LSVSFFSFSLASFSFFAASAFSFNSNCSLRFFSFSNAMSTFFFVLSADSVLTGLTGSAFFIGSGAFTGSGAGSGSATGGGGGGAATVDCGLQISAYTATGFWFCQETLNHKTSNKIKCMTKAKMMARQRPGSEGMRLMKLVDMNKDA
jgi:hypothetical protein